MDDIRIDGKTIGPGHKPYIIAEMSANHNGSLEQALKTLEVFAGCGVDAIKMQTYTADTMTIDSNKKEFQITDGLWAGYSLYDLYKEAETPYKWHQTLFDKAKKLGITLFSTPFDETAVDLLEELNTPAYKIASFELTDLPLIKKMARTQKPIIASTGMANLQEIDEAVETARNYGCKDLILLHCVSGYPTPVNQSNIAVIPDLARRYDCVIGLSDHSMGTAVSVAAIALGARVIEKHATLDRNNKGPDSAFSLEPNEFTRLCEDTNDAWEALGVVGYERKPAEISNAKFRRSIYFVKDMQEGEIITDKHIRRIRPGFGLEPKYFDELIGKSVKKNIERGTAASWDLIEK